jgi:ABC-2 type transport system permease protein
MTPRFLDLFAWEWRQAGRAPLLWTILAILCASFMWGAVNTSWLHQAQSLAISQAAKDADVQDAAARALARDFHEPVTPEKGQVAYWQDPTNVAGYSEYFVKSLAAKPHLPASPLAVGVSDLAPSRLEIKLNTPFGFVDTYDFQNPRGLALGRFDLAFAAVFLAPAALILLLCLLATVERDRGMLRLVASQSTGSVAWVSARLLAILAWVLPVINLGLALAMAVAGASLEAAGAIGAAAVLLTAYLLFWAAVAFVVLLWQPAASSALSILAATWAVLTIGAPIALGALLSALDPAPSSVAYVDAQRRVGDAVQAERDAIIARAVAQRPDLTELGRPLSSLDHATRLSFLVPETERRLSALRTAAHAHRLRQHRAAQAAGYVLPALGVEGALARLAGVDAARHLQFELQAQAHQARLRGVVYPLVQAEMLEPPPPEQRATRGILNLDQPPNLPAFAFAEADGPSPAARALGYGLWLSIAAGLIAAAAAARFKAWRVL